LNVSSLYFFFFHFFRTAFGFDFSSAFKFTFRPLARTHGPSLTRSRSKIKTHSTAITRALALSFAHTHSLTHSLSMRASALSSAFEKYLSDIFLLLLYFYYFCFISFCVDCAADCVNASARVQGSERYAGADDAFALHLATSLARSHVGHGCCCCR